MREIKFRAWDKEEQEMLDWDKFFNLDIAQVFESKGSWGVYPMQYTGLKDKNGVEIYEGDILSYFGFEYEVIFEESAFGWYEGGQFYAFAEMAIDEIAKTKIIGNRFENPELLEEDQ